MKASIDIPRRSSAGALARFAALTVAGALCAGVALAQPPSAQPPEWEPVRGQAGKDVIWIPTPDEVVQRLLQLARVTPSDLVVDLGSGDGKIVIAAARDFKARGRGVEFNADMVELSRRNARAAGVADRTEFIRGDIFQTDYSDATVVAMYLLPDLNLRLRPTLLAMKPGTRVVSHDFDMGDWEADELSKASLRSAHLWIVPANAGGEWKLRFAQRPGAAEVVMKIEQRFQKIRGHAIVGSGFETTLREPRISGDRIAFAFTDEEGRLREFRGTVAGNRMTGEVTSSAGGAAVPFSAERQGAAPPIGGAGPVERSWLEKAVL